MEEERIKPNDVIKILLTEETDLSRFFGTFKIKKTTQELKDESRRIWSN